MCGHAIETFCLELKPVAGIIKIFWRSNWRLSMFYCRVVNYPLSLR